MALVGSYSRRGASMPLVLDDVLVNFDLERARAAAGVLRDFSASGHQLLVFTCHEHLAAMFKSLDVRVRQLPSNAELVETPAPDVEQVSRSGVPPLNATRRDASSTATEPPKRRRAKPKSDPQPAAKPPVDHDASLELVPLDELPIPPPITAEILPPEPIVPRLVADPVELPARQPLPMREHRADPPHKRVILRRFRRRWSAEEFEGELEDRVAAGFGADDRIIEEDLNGDTSDI
jgi:hypothetical protein